MLKIIFFLLILSSPIFCDVDSIHGWKRVTFQGKEVSSNFCGYSQGSCNLSDYFSAIAVYTTGFVAVGFLTLFMFIFWGCFRPLCCRCFKCFEFRGSTERTRKVMTLIVVLFLIFSIVTFSISLSGSSKISGGFNEMGEKVVNVSEKVQKKVLVVNKALKAFDDSYNFDSAVKAADSIVDGAKTARDTLNTGNDVRNSLIASTSSFVLLLLIVSTIFLFFGSTVKGSRGVSICVLFFIFVLWLVFALHFFTMVLFADICYEIEKGDNNDSLDILINCSKSDSFDVFSGPTSDLQQKNDEMGCTKVETLCNQKANLTNHNKECSQDPQSCNQDDRDFTNWQNEKMPNFEKGCYDPNNAYDNQDCGENSQSDCSSGLVWTQDQCVHYLTIDQCKDDCNDKTLKDASSEYGTLEEDHNTLKGINDDISDLVDCSLINDGWSSLRNSLCVKSFGGFELFIGGGITYLVFATLLCIIFIICRKLFIQKFDEYNLLNENEQGSLYEGILLDQK
ncbi:transmembrane protein [Anaeramoeba flamelloides]|uniref:Transmembrane protein n=1 Tax=Anaeramoeba flamelloides TaxID=1746091 RepID=A0ABQ8XW39_9EUKA|nr:transmembrane protein [Anaeramoeba flamelloides]